jgi:hypothetical protein
VPAADLGGRLLNYLQRRTTLESTRMARRDGIQAAAIPANISVAVTTA